jgi:hypothetical protein
MCSRDYRADDFREVSQLPMRLPRFVRAALGKK